MLRHASGVAAFCLCLLPTLLNAQTSPAKEAPTQTKKAAGKGAARDKADPLARERRLAAMSLATSLADEARQFRDEALRARVQARTADALWETDQERARALFRRAWDAADAVDRESARRAEEERRTEASMRDVTVHSSGTAPNLRGEVLRLASRRDRSLGEEFLAKLTEATEKETATLTAGADSLQNQTTQDPESPPPAVVQRLRLARQFVEEGDVERALQFADGALDRVTTRGINLLSALREKNQAEADKRFAAMLARVAADPLSDATTVSVLSSYAFTPFLTVVVRRDGRNHTSQERDRITAPAMSPELRGAFFNAAAQILLRPIPPPDQDRTLAGRSGLYFTIARLLPLFEQYAPDFAPELRAQLGTLTPDAPEQFRTGRDNMLTRGLVPTEMMRDEGQEALERANRAPSGEERDLLYARAALEAARKGDVRARDYVEKIDNSDTRKRARAHVDFTLVNRAIDKKDEQEALRLTRTGELTNVHRAWALMEVARLMKKTDPTRAAEILNEAATEARRISGSDPDRVRALIGIATQMYEIDRSRVWEAVAEAVKAANSASNFTGEDAQIVSRFSFGRGASTTSFTVGGFDLGGIFGLLAKDDLNRAVEMAKSFNGEAPRAVATLAIVRSVLDKKKG